MLIFDHSHQLYFYTSGTQRLVSEEALRNEDYNTSSKQHTEKLNISNCPQPALGGNTLLGHLLSVWLLFIHTSPNVHILVSEYFIWYQASLVIQPIHSPSCLYSLYKWSRQGCVSFRPKKLAGPDAPAAVVGLLYFGDAALTPFRILSLVTWRLRGISVMMTFKMHLVLVLETTCMSCVIRVMISWLPVCVYVCVVLLLSTYSSGYKSCPYICFRFYFTCSILTVPWSEIHFHSLKNILNPHKKVTWHFSYIKWIYSLWWKVHLELERLEYSDNWNWLLVLLLCQTNIYIYMKFITTTYLDKSFINVIFPLIACRIHNNFLINIVEQHILHRSVIVIYMCYKYRTLGCNVW